MATTYREFVDALSSLVISGVTHRFTKGPPEAGNTADTPFQYVDRNVGGGDKQVIFQVAGGTWPTLKATLVIAVNPTAQSTGPDNFNLTVDMLDNAQAALAGSGCTIAAHTGWTMRMGGVQVAGGDYWAIIVDVEGRG